MIKYNLNNINKWYLGNGNPIAKMYHGSTVAYDVTGGGEPTPPTPPQSDCYGVTYPSITAYSDTTYSSVYSFTDSKWYMKNNLNQYEEYGVYETGTSLSDFTTYEGKLVAIGTVEYQYSGESWSVVGEYINSSTTYEIDGSDMYKYQGVTLSTTFKIPVADVEAVEYVDLTIRTENSESLYVMTDRYYLSGVETGTVTSDSEYYYYSLPTTQEVVIDRIDWRNSETIHIIVGTMEATVQYPEKSIPSSALTYSSVADMQAAQCPDVGVGQLCYTDGQTYKFTSDDWVQDSNTFIKQFYDDGRVGVLSCGYNNNVLMVGILGNKAGTIPSSDPTIEVIIGDCVTTIDDNALYGLRNMSACTIGSGVTSIGANAFSYCYSLSSVTIPNSVTSFSARIFNGCTGLTSVIFGDNVTQIGGYMFNGCTKLSSVTFNTVTPPPMPYSNTFEGCSCIIYVPAASLNAYKSASGWSSYASRIRAIPT